ncbi:MAG: hypothetical protein ACRCYR_08130 [Phycicoccus sp.]
MPPWSGRDRAVADLGTGGATADEHGNADPVAGSHVLAVGHLGTDLNLHAVSHTDADGLADAERGAG